MNIQRWKSNGRRIWCVRWGRFALWPLHPGEKKFGRMRYVTSHWAFYCWPFLIEYRRGK